MAGNLGTQTVTSWKRNLMKKVMVHDDSPVSIHIYTLGVYYNSRLPPN